MKEKTINHSNKKKIVAKPRTMDVDPKMDYSFRTIPVSKAMVNRLIEELKEWPFNPANVHKTITQFYIRNGFKRRTYYDLLNKYPDLKDMHEQTMLQMGEDLWFRSVEKKFDWSPVKHRLYRYSPEFQEDSEYNAAIAAKAREGADNGNVQYIVVDTTGKKLNE